MRPRTAHRPGSPARKSRRPLRRCGAWRARTVFAGRVPAGLGKGSCASAASGWPGCRPALFQTERRPRDRRPAAFGLPAHAPGAGAVCGRSQYRQPGAECKPFAGWRCVAAPLRHYRYIALHWRLKRSFFLSRIPWSLGARLLARDWRSGEVLVLLAALVVAVAAISAVTFFTDRVRAAVSQQAGEALAADLRIDSSSDVPAEVQSAAERHGLESARVVSLRSVVVAGQTTSLADVRGVTAAYPLRGEVRVAERLGGIPQPASGAPRRGEAWAEPSLLARLGLAV